MILNQIATEVSMLHTHLTSEEPNLEFILTHVQAAYQLAAGLAESNPALIASERDRMIYNEYREARLLRCAINVNGADAPQ
jgi:hypothetical protein